jgi:hypothetical protein
MESVGRNDNSEYGKAFLLLTERGCQQRQRLDRRGPALLDPGLARFRALEYAETSDLRNFGDREDMGRSGAAPLRKGLPTFERRV